MGTVWKGLSCGIRVFNEQCRPKPPPERQILEKALLRGDFRCLDGPIFLFNPVWTRNWGKM